MTITKREATIQIGVRWQTDACTTVEIPRPPRSCDLRRTPPATVERIRALAPTHTDAQIAALLGDEGHRPGLGGTFTAAKVQWIRWRYQLPRSRPAPAAARADSPRADGRYTARAAAELLNVNVGTIAEWCIAGRLDYLQEAPHHPRWITLTPERIAALRKPVRQRKPRRAAQQSNGRRAVAV